MVPPQNFIFKSRSVWPDSNWDLASLRTPELFWNQSACSMRHHFEWPHALHLQLDHIFSSSHILSHSFSFLLLCFLVHSPSLKLCLAFLCNPHLYFISLKIVSIKKSAITCVHETKTKWRIGMDSERRGRAAAKDSCSREVDSPCDSLSLSPC